MARKKIFLGDLLVDEGLITSAQRDEALVHHKRIGKRLGEVLVGRGLVSEEMIARTLSKQLSLNFTDLSEARPEAEVLQVIPKRVAVKLKVLPLEINQGKLLLAMVDPLDVFAMDEVKRHLRTYQYSHEGGEAALDPLMLGTLSIDIVVATETQLMRAVEKFYVAEVAAPPPEVDAAELEAADDTPVVKLVNTIISQAVTARASDVHIEPDMDSLRVRFRVDGLLHEAMSPPLDIHAGLVSRLKILSGMDIAEKRLPQDGRFNTTSGGKQLDIRSSTLPTMHGEKMVLRLLEKTAGVLDLEKLGFNPEDTFPSYIKLIKRPYGFVLSTGPTGSGKTTTLYATLKTIISTENNIITVEDPIEYNLKGINQVQVNPKAGLTFANGLRSILRQDPDIIMIGEIRDQETAAIAMHAALTGHLVLSTLHTNEAVGAVARLIDMGMEPFLITSSLIGVLGQRLIRKVCTHCRVKTKFSGKIFEEIGVTTEVTIYNAKGCAKCRHTGYLGREGLYELLLITEQVKKLIVRKAPESEIKQAAQQEGFNSMRQEGLLKVLSGITTLQEVVRVTAGLE